MSAAKPKRLLTSDERRRILFAPITRGILATTTYAGRSSAGSGIDGPRLPVRGVRGNIVGHRRGVVKSV